MHAAAAKEQHSPLSQHHLFTVRDPRTGTQKSHNSRDCHPRLMTVSPQSSGHSWTQPFNEGGAGSAFVFKLFFMPYHNQMASRKATSSGLISEIRNWRNFLHSGCWRKLEKEAVRNVIPEISAPQTALPRPSFRPPLLHLT